MPPVKLLTVSFLFFLSLSGARAQTPTAPASSAAPAPSATPVAAAETSTSPAPSAPPVILLWPEGAPGALGDAPTDKPTLTAYLPEPAKRNGASMLVLPGGGYSHLAEHEGKGYAEWLAANGVCAYVLKYRLGPEYHHPAMLNDAARALRMLRSFAKRDGLDPARIGVIGSSAGGHLASTLVTHFDAGKPDAADPFDRESSRPDLGVLCYAVITMGEFSHSGSKKSLLGDQPDPSLVQLLSNEAQVTAETPPCFLWHTVADKTVPVENSLLFAAALRQAGVPFSLHLYEKGAHGLGLGRPAQGTQPARPAPPWADQLLYWFRERKFIP